MYHRVCDLDIDAKLNEVKISSKDVVKSHLQYEYMFQIYHLQMG